MKIVLIVLAVLLLISYWRFTGKRRYLKKMVVVTENRYARLHTQQSKLDLACAYMNAQRYADAYEVYADIIPESESQAEGIR